MASNIRPAGVFDTSYQQDIALFRTRQSRIGWGFAFILVLLIPIVAGRAIPIFGVTLIPDLWVGLVIRLCILIIAVQGLNILIGYTGQISLGHSAFVAVGGYTAAILGREFGWSFWFALPASALFTGVIGLIFGLPSLRVKGFYLAMATLAAQFIIPWALEHPLEPWTNGLRPLNVPTPVIGPFGVYETIRGDGPHDREVTLSFETGHPILTDYVTVRISSTAETLPEIVIVGADGDTLPNSALIVETEGTTTDITFTAAKPGTYTVTATPEEESSDPFTLQIDMRKSLSFASEDAFYYIIFPLTVILMIAAHNIIRSRVGRAFISVRDNDLAAELLGINVFLYKLQAFFLSAVYAGIAGALMAYETNSLSLDFFTLGQSIDMLAMVVIGGAGFPLGAVFGAGFFNLFNDVFIPGLSPFLRDVLPRMMPFVDVVNIYAALNPVLFGLALMVFLIAEPRGLAYRWEILKIAWKIRPYSY